MVEPTRALTEADFAVSAEERRFEDYQVGVAYEYGYASIDEAELLEFARRYDPQLMHTDAEFAATGPFGGLIASGWQTASVFMRMFADHYLPRGAASLASPGLDELRWTAPVRPGDTLWIKVEAIEARRSRSKPDRGVIRTHGEMFNQDDVRVLSVVALNLIRSRR